MDLNDDPRWQRLTTQDWTCPACGRAHRGLFDLATRHPAQWPHGEDCEPNSALRLDGDFLSEDFCVLRGEHFFVRSLLVLPIIGSDAEFAFGVWGTLSRQNFDLYLDTFDAGAQGHLGPWFSWFSCDLRAYPNTVNLKAQMYPREGRQRPVLELMADDHPLALEQRNGVTFDRVLELYALHDHDIRAALGPA